MPDTTVARRSMLARSWRVVSAGPKAYFRPVRQALDVPSIMHSWDLMRDVQRRTFRPSKTPASGIRLIEKDGQFDAEGTQAWMEAYARRQLAVGRTSQDVLSSWETATPADVSAWARHEVLENRRSVYVTIGKAAACGLAALLSAALVTRPSMAVMSTFVLMLLFVFFALRSFGAIRNQAYLECLIRKQGPEASFVDQNVPAGRLGPFPALNHGEFS